MMRSEIRRREKLPFVPGSDKLTVQSALTNLDTLGEPTPPGKTIEDSQKV